MASGLEDLAKNVLGNTRVEATDVESALVGLRSGAAAERTTTGGRNDAALVAATQGRGDRGRDGVRVLRNMERRGWHMGGVLTILAILIARSTRIRLRRRGKLASALVGTVISHF